MRISKTIIDPIKRRYKIFIHFTRLLDKANRLCICNVIRSVVESACSMKSESRELFLLTFAAFRFPLTFRSVPPIAFSHLPLNRGSYLWESTKSLGTSLIHETKASRLKFVYCNPGCFYRVRRYSFYYNDKTDQAHSRFPPAVLFI